MAELLWRTAIEISTKRDKYLRSGEMRLVASLFENLAVNLSITNATARINRKKRKVNITFYLCVLVVSICIDACIAKERIAQSLLVVLAYVKVTT